MNTPPEDMILLYCPCPSREDALRLGRMLISQRLAACVNILPGGTSVFVWDGHVQETTEHVLLAKTSALRQQAATDTLVSEHPYDCPAILAFPVTASPAFAAWVAGIVNAPS